MTHLKRFLSYALVLTLMLCFSAKLSVNAADKETKVTDHVTMIGSAVKGSLWDGVTYERMHITSERAGSYTSTDAGLIYHWDSVAVIADANPAIKVASWGLSKQDGYQQGTTAAIAKDYEVKHPGYTVLAGVNGDFFANTTYKTSTGKEMPATFEPINCWVADGGISLKSAVLANPHHQVIGIRLDRTYTYHIGAHWNSDGTYADTSDAMQKHGQNVPEFTDTLMFHAGDALVPAYITSSTLSEDGVNIILGGSNIDVTGYAVYKCYIDRQCRANDGFQGKYFIGYNYPDHQYDIDYTGIYINGRSTGAVQTNTIASVETNYCYIVTKNDAVKNHLNTKAASFTAQYDLTGDEWGDVNSTIGTVIPFIIDGEKTQYVSNSNNYLNDNKPKTIVAFDANNKCIFYFMGPGPLSNTTASGPSSIEIWEMLDKYGAVNAFCLDGGGSATICVKNAAGGFDTVNNATDPGGVRSIGNALLMIVENSNLATTEVTATTATFGQTKPMADSTLKSATLHFNGKTYNLTGTETVKVEGLTANKSYEYYYDYTYENDGVTYSSKTNTLTFTTLSSDPVVEKDPENFKVTLDGQKDGSYDLTGSFDANGKDATMYVVIGEKAYKITSKAKEVTSSEVSRVYYVIDDEEFEVEDYELIINEYQKPEDKPSADDPTEPEKKPSTGGMNCSFGAYCISLVAGLGLTILVLKKRH